jgi:diguanylate cyclase (GGDEF)-like protein
VLNDWLPFFAFVISLCGSALIGGAGAFAYPVPALLWCAVRYDLFYVACCSLLYCAVQTIIVSSGLYPSYVMGDALNSIMSVRLAIVLIALGPLSVASINLARNELIAKLEHALRYDFLTNSLTRREFIGKATTTLSRTAGNRSVTAVLLLDIDHFKSINDRFGHSVGDQVLVAFVSRISDMLGEHDLLGRIGGEEFGVILSSTTVERATRMAEFIRKAVEDLRISHPDADGLSITVSGGLAFAHREGPRALDILLSRADALLYEAKNSGRNRIVASSV